MQQLWLMRHGRAVSNHPEGDAARPLSEDGVAGIQSIAKSLEKLPFRPQEFWASPFRRAQMTADGVHAVVGGVRREAAGCTPSGDPRSAAAKLAEAGKDIWLISHMPFLPALVQELTRTNVNMNFEPGAIAHLAWIRSDYVVLLGLYAPGVLETLE